MSLEHLGCLGVKCWSLIQFKMENNLKLAVEVMGRFIGSRDVKGYTKETLMKAYGLDEGLADELIVYAWKEWVDAYSD